MWRVGHAAGGVSVATLVAALYVTVTPGTGLFEESVNVKDSVAGWIASLNVAVAVVVTATPVAFGAGVWAVTAGGVVSGTPVVNDHVTGVIALPARSSALVSVAV